MDKSLLRKTVNKKAKDAGAPPGESSALLAAAQLAVGAFGGAILLVYPIGFLTLWVQIMLTHDYSSPEALFATSMVPTSVVAGGALFVLITAPSAAFLMFYIALLFAWLIEKQSAALKEKKRFRLWTWLPTVVYLVITFVPLGTIFYYGILRDPPPHMGAWILLAAVFSLCIGGSFSGSLSHRANVAQGSGRHLRYIVPAIPFAAGAVVVGVCLNMLISELRLPTIELQKKHSDDSVKGTLLSHSDGSWHLINSAADTRPLLAIPDERVFKVTIAEQITAEQTTAEQTIAEQTTSEKAD